MNIAEVSAITFAIQSFVTLFVIFDPPGAAPIFLGLVADRTPKERRKLAVQAASISSIILRIRGKRSSRVLSRVSSNAELVPSKSKPSM